MHEEDLSLVKAALAGDEAAGAEIRSADTTDWLEAVLVKRGAASSEASDLVADLFADCFGAKKGKDALLTKYNGQGKLRAFLTRAAINRLIDYKRRQKFEGSLPQRDFEDAPTDEFDLLEGGAVDTPSDDTLVDLLRDALSVAFGKCDPLGLMVMRLVVVHGVGQSAVASMLGWSQPKVSRAITSTMETVRSVTMEEIQVADPWLELEWEDFLTLCRSSTDFLAGTD